MRYESNVITYYLRKFQPQKHEKTESFVAYRKVAVGAKTLVGAERAGEQMTRSFGAR